MKPLPNNIKELIEKEYPLKEEESFRNAAYWGYSLSGKIAIDFAEWTSKNEWYYTPDYNKGDEWLKGWVRYFRDYEEGSKEEFKTTEELFNLYLQTLNK